MNDEKQNYLEYNCKLNDPKQKIATNKSFFKQTKIIQKYDIYKKLMEMTVLNYVNTITRCKLKDSTKNTIVA